MSSNILPEEVATKGLVAQEIELLLSLQDVDGYLYNDAIKTVTDKDIRNKKGIISEYIKI